MVAGTSCRTRTFEKSGASACDSETQYVCRSLATHIDSLGGSVLMRNASRGHVRQKPAGNQQPSKAGTALFCTPRQWGVAIISGLIVSGLAWPAYASVSCWIGVVLLLMVVTVVHMVFTYRLVVCLPHIAILVSGLQYVLAAWLSFYYPAS